MRLIPLSYVISLNTLDGSIPQFPLFTRPGGKKEGSSVIILVYPDAAVRRFFVRIEEARQQQRNPSQLPFLPRIPGEEARDDAQDKGGFHISTMKYQKELGIPTQLNMHHPFEIELKLF